MKYSEEEKKAINDLKYLLKRRYEDEIETYNLFGSIKTALNLIDKQQKEIEELNNKYNFEKVAKEEVEELLDDSMPKEKIRKKIDDLQRYKGLVMYEKYNYDAIIRHLKELLGE